MRNLPTARSLAKGFEPCALDFMHSSPDRRTRVLFINSALLAGADTWIHFLLLRNLPKVVWVLIVVLLPTVGSIAWLVAGRPWDPQPNMAPTGVGRQFPEYDRPGRHVAQSSDDDEEFLRQVRARAEEQRQRAAEERRRREEQGLD